MTTWTDDLFEEVEKFLLHKRHQLVAELSTVDELLRRHREHGHHHHGARLERIAIQFNPAPSTLENTMNVTLTTAGQKATASVRGFDQDGKPMAADFQIPPVTFTGDNDAAATVTENPDGETAEVTAVANGTANVNASVTNDKGDVLNATGQVTVEITVEPPPAQVLTSIEVAFDVPAAAVDEGGAAAEEPAPADPSVPDPTANMTPNQKLAALNQK